MSILNRKRTVFLASLTILLTSLLWLGFSNSGDVSGKAKSQLKGFRIISPDELAKFDGSNDKLPIYLAYEGLVYDVSEGSEYYLPGATYHYLVGRDATDDLKIFGGEIIKRKYPVIGVLNK